MPDPEGEQVAMAGYDPNRVSLRALEKALGRYANDEISAEEIGTVAERLTREERQADLDRQDMLDWMEKHSLG